MEFSQKWAEEEGKLNFIGKKDQQLIKTNFDSKRL